MRTLILLLTLLATAGTWAAEFFVGPDGRDDNPGTPDAPFASLAKARDAARGAEAPTTIWLNDGVYSLGDSVAFSAEDGGKPDAPRQIRAVNPGKARLWGGRALDPASFGSAGGNSRLSETARPHVLQYDLAAAEIEALGTYPDQFRTAVTLPELFFNGARMELARWPNEGWAEIDEVIESGPAPWRNHESDVLGAFTFSGDHPTRWAGATELWLEGYWCFDWASETIRVQSVDPASKQITLAKQHVYGIGSGNPAPRRFRAVNLLEELDEAGEYYIDRAAKTLYFWPPAPLEGAEIVLSLASDPLLAFRDASHITVTGLVFEYTAGTAITVEGGEQITIAGCEIRNAGQIGIHTNGGTNHAIQSCDIHHNGTGGVQVTGGDRKTLTPSGHRIVNNHIYRVSERMRTSAYNIRVDGVGVYIAHNEINDAPHQAIGLAGNDHIFELNDIHHVSTQSDDCGAFYMGRNPSTGARSSGTTTGTKSGANLPMVAVPSTSTTVTAARRSTATSSTRLPAATSAPYSTTAAMTTL